MAKGTFPIWPGEENYEFFTEFTTKLEALVKELQAQDLCDEDVDKLTGLEDILDILEEVTG